MKRMLAALLVASPWLQGAGCTTHYGAHLKAEVKMSEPQEAPVLVKFRLQPHDTCLKSWPQCLKEHKTWRPMRGCKEEVEGGRAPLKISGASKTHQFDACTGMVGVYYKALLMAFVDLNDNGQLDDGEPYGLYKNNPLTRETEPKEGRLTIEIDQLLKPASSP